VSKTYLIYRWVVAILVTLFFGHSLLARLINSIETSWKYLLYLTNWSRLLASLAYLLEASLVTQRWRRELGGKEAVDNVEGGYAVSCARLPCSHRLLWLLANINTDLALFCSIIYWPFLYEPSSHLLSVENVTGHALLTLLNSLDLFVSARPWRCLHAYHVQLFCLAYALSNFTYIEEGGTNLKDQPYIYSILDWRKPTHCLFTIFGVLLLLPFIHLFHIMLYKLRCSLANKVSEMSRLKREQEVAMEMEVAEGSKALLEP